MKLGLLSTTESVHFGKPIVGTPVFYDQYINMKMAEAKGYAVTVPYEDFSEEKLKAAVRTILTNSRYNRHCAQNTFKNTNERN